MDASQYITVGDQQLHYLQWGSGKCLLLAFHGYGNDAGIFLPFAKYLSDDYTILSFDLPHHGHSKWTEDAPLTKKDLLTLVEKLKTAYKADKVSLMGYSMGGRVCLTITEYMPQSIDKVTLIAADGLSMNFYYYFFTRTLVGKKMFRHMLENPQRYFRIMDWLKNKHILDASRHKFATQYLYSPESRKFLLQVWPAMRDLVPKPVRLKSAIRQFRIPISIFMGAYDKIMPPALATRFKTGLDTVQVHILEKGHRVFDRDNAQQIAASLL
jgi:pimeloyl-ACP methyl ester carboxylesterase